MEEGDDGKLCPLLPNLALTEQERDRVALRDLIADGHYEPVRKLGDGTYATVYLCRRIRPSHADDGRTRADTQTGAAMCGSASVLDRSIPEEREELLAVKVVQDHAARTQEVAAGLLLAGQPGIAGLREWRHSGRSVLMAHEFVNGVDLQVLTEHLPSDACFPEEAVRGLFERALRAVQRCHRAGIAHRDIKMENVVLHGPSLDRVALVDFGLCFLARRPQPPPGAPASMAIRARPIDPLVHTPLWRADERPPRFSGTEEYCAPELLAAASSPRSFFACAATRAFQAGARRRADRPARADQETTPPDDGADGADDESDCGLYLADAYSLGVVLFYMLLGRFPRGEAFHKDLFRSLRERSPSATLEYVAALPASQLRFYRMGPCVPVGYGGGGSAEPPTAEPGPPLSDEARDLLSGLLEVVPERRLTVDAALQHPWVWCPGPPRDPARSHPLSA